MRVACVSATCRSRARTPRTLPAITDPTATITTATNASATSTSRIVKPASRRSVDGDVTGNNLDPPGQPVDADFIGRIEARQRDGAAAGHAVGEEANGRQRRLPLARLRQHRVKMHVVGNADSGLRRAG